MKNLRLTVQVLMVVAASAMTTALVAPIFAIQLLPSKVSAAPTAGVWSIALLPFTILAIGVFFIYQTRGQQAEKALVRRALIGLVSSGIAFAAFLVDLHLHL